MNGWRTLTCGLVLISPYLAVEKREYQYKHWLRRAPNDRLSFSTSEGDTLSWQFRLLLGIVLAVTACFAIPAFSQQSQVLSSASELKQSIEQRKLRVPAQPEYLYSTDTFTGAVSTVWIDLTGHLLGSSQLRSSYDEFYFAALGYRSEAVRAIYRAGRSLDGGDIERANDYIREFDRYEKLFTLSNNGAIAAYEGNSSSASTFAQGIYDGSKASVKFGAKFVLGPTGSRLVDQGFDVADFMVDAPELGLAQAAKKALSKQLVDVVFDLIPIDLAGGKTISQFLDKSSGKIIGSSGLYALLDEAFRSPQFAKELMRFLGKSGQIITEETAKSFALLALSNMAQPSSITSSTVKQPATADTSESCTEPVTKPGYSGQEAALALGPTIDNDRAIAIYYMVQGRKFREPQCGKELGAALKGATGRFRAAAIQALVLVTKNSLTGEDAAAMLGSAKECSDADRANAIYYLAVGNKFKPDLSGKELEMILDGATGRFRALAIDAISNASKK